MLLVVAKHRETVASSNACLASNSSFKASNREISFYFHVPLQNRYNHSITLMDNLSHRDTKVMEKDRTHWTHMRKKLPGSPKVHLTCLTLIAVPCSIGFYFKLYIELINNTKRRKTVLRDEHAIWQVQMEASLTSMFQGGVWGSAVVIEGFGPGRCMWTGISWLGVIKVTLMGSTPCKQQPHPICSSAQMYREPSAGPT